MKIPLAQSAGVLLLLFSLSPYARAGHTVQGDYAGNQVWNDDTVKISGNVVVRGTLFIMPGTFVEFQGHYELTADSILANGSIGDSITFTIKDTLGFGNHDIPDGGWKRIVAKYYLEIGYCKIMFGKYIDTDGLEPGWEPGILKISESGYNPVPLVIKNSLFYNNISSRFFVFVDPMESYDISGSTFINNKFISFRWYSVGHSHISNCNFNGNYGSFEQVSVEACNFERNISLGFSSLEGSTYITNCHFLHNQSLYMSGGFHADFRLINCRLIENGILGIGGRSSSGMTIEGNIITNGSSGGISLNDCNWDGENVNIINNTFYNNEVSGNEAFISIMNTYTRFYNNIIYGNENLEGIQISFRNSDGVDSLNGEFKNNLIQYGLNAIEYSGIKGVVENTIDQEPQFVNAAIHDYNLANTSPCINSGKTDIEGIQLSDEDLAGNPRILDFQTDLGAYEYNPEHPDSLKQPMGGSVCIGESFTMTTYAFGGVLGYQWQKNGTDILGASADSLLLEGSGIPASGKYNCKIITADSTISTDTVQFNVNPLPEVYLGKDTTIYTNEQLTLNAGEGFANYLWNTGDADNQLTVEKTETGAYEYWVKVTDNNSCSIADTILVKVDLASNFSDSPAEITIQAYPNPTSGLVHLVFSGELQNESITITDLSGKVQMQKNFDTVFEGTEYQLDLSSLQDGIYFLVIGNKRMRIIKN